MTRSDDYPSRRAHLRSLSDDELHAYFWELVEKVVAPMIEEAATHTSPSIERSVLLRMGFSSLETRTLVDGMLERGLLGHGAGHLVNQLARKHAISVRAAGLGLLDGRHWEDIAP